MRHLWIKTVILLFLFSATNYAKIITIQTENSTLPSGTSPTYPQMHDVKFIVESSVSTAHWDPGVSLENKTKQKLFEYRTEGLNLYSVKGKVNIFDSDVITIEKYGSFSGTSAQNNLIKQYKKDLSEKSGVAGLNISIKAFLLLKYFYLYDYKYFDALEYRYETYKFYGIATNKIDTYFWYGKQNEGTILEDFFPLSVDSTIRFYTDFSEHRFYVLQLTDMIDLLKIESIKVGVYSTNWLKPLFIGQHNQDNIPIIHHGEFVSNGLTFDIMQSFLDKRINFGLQLDLGIDNHINYSSNSLDVDYMSYNFYVDYNYKIYSNKTYEIYTQAKAFLSKKKFDIDTYNLDAEDVRGLSVGIRVVF